MRKKNFLSKKEVQKRDFRKMIRNIYRVEWQGNIYEDVPGGCKLEALQLVLSKIDPRKRPDCLDEFVVTKKENFGHKEGTI